MIKDLEAKIEGAESLVFVNFHGLNVADESTLRRDLRKENVGYRVSRKTLLKRALAGKAEGELPPLEGEIAIVYSSDPISSAREVYNFQKVHSGVPSIVGGIFEGKFVDAVKMMEIATIPSREVLLSKFAFLLQSPMQRFAVALNEVAKLRP